MKAKHIFLFASGLFLTHFAFSVSAAVIQKGGVEIQYDSLRSMHNEGYECYEHETECKDFLKTCENQIGSMLNTKADIHYSIVKETGYHYAELIYDNTTLRMSAMGILNTYSFISSSIPSELVNKFHIKNVFFTIDSEFQEFRSMMTFNLKDPKYQCVLSGSFKK